MKSSEKGSTPPGSKGDTHPQRMRCLLQLVVRTVFGFRGLPGGSVFVPSTANVLLKATRSDSVRETVLHTPHKHCFNLGRVFIISCKLQKDRNKRACPFVLGCGCLRERVLCGHFSLFLTHSRVFFFPASLLIRAQILVYRHLQRKEMSEGILCANKPRWPGRHVFISMRIFTLTFVQPNVNPLNSKDK